MTSGAIIVEHVSHSFGEGALERQVLFDVSTEVRAGEIVILMGPSGSGKTTLLTLMGALRSTRAGSLRVLGRELCGAGQAELAEIRKRIGYIFQAHNLLEALSAQQNVELSLEPFDELTGEERRRRAADALVAVGLGERRDAHPSQLSGGQRQRVAIARAIARRPDILLADEPTASLDRESGRSVVELIERLARKDGVTVVLVTHDNRILDVADRILALEDGRLTSLMNALTVDAKQMMHMLAEDIRKGELVRRVAGMDEPAFAALLEGVTSETQRLLEIVDAVQSDAFESMLGQVIEASTAKLAEILRADRARLFFLDEDSGGLWSLARCEHGRYGEVRAPAAGDETAKIAGTTEASSALRGPSEASPAETSGASANALLRLPVADSHGRTFAVVELARTSPALAFDPADERRLAELSASLGTILESWWRMSCRCRAGAVGRLPSCCAGGPVRARILDRPRA
jgi:putative ABC transport system ATP-binding protein